MVILCVCVCAPPDTVIPSDESMCPSIIDGDGPDYHMTFSAQNRYSYNSGYVDPSYGLMPPQGGGGGSGDVAMRHFKQLGSINILSDCIGQDSQKSFSSSNFKSPSSHSLSLGGGGGGGGGLCSSGDNTKKEIMDVCMLDADWIESCSDFSQGHSQKSWSPINK